MSSNSDQDRYWAERAAQVEADLLTRIPENKLRPRLEPTRRAVELLGDPQRSYRVIHVTGTNGKTSTTRIIERLLREHGLRTGRFTSPHLVKLNERMSLDGEPVSDERLAAVWQDIAPILEIADAELLAAGDTRLTFFEALAVLGFAVFADAPVDVLVLEVGMGGEWDSTNVADGDVAVFTPIDLDHMERLGETIAEIASTKSGIIKRNSFVVSSVQTPEAESVLRAKATDTADRFAYAGEQFGLISSDAADSGRRLSVRGLAGEYHDLFLPLYGEHQAENAALAIAAVEAFLGFGERQIPADIVRAALVDVSSPGRLQVLQRNPLVVLDAAHNPQGARILAKALPENFGSRPFTAVISMLSDKDRVGFLSGLEPAVEKLIVTECSSPRATPVDELAATAVAIFGEDRVSVEPNPSRALEIAQDAIPLGVSEGILVTGSISLLGDILSDLQKKENDD